MARPLLVLADPDETYLAPLELRFLEELGESIDLSVITDKAYFEEFMMEPHDIEALLIDESWYTGAVGIQNIENLFVLVEDQDHNRTSIMAAEYTFKYSSINDIFGKVVGVCTRLKSEIPGASSCSVVLFFSPVGGSGCTTAALGTAAALSAMYKRVLYVDAEYVQSFRCFLSDGKVAPAAIARDMAKLSGDAYENVSAYIESDGFDYLPPLRAGLSAYGVEFDFFHRLLTAVRESGAYDYVIVDTDSVFNDEKTELIGLADCVFVTVNQDRVSLFKTMKLLDNIDATSGDKFRYVCSKYAEGVSNAFSGSVGSATVEFDGFISRNDDIQAMNASQLGELEDFRRLARSIG